MPGTSRSSPAGFSYTEEAPSPGRNARGAGRAGLSGRRQALTHRRGQASYASLKDRGSRDAAPTVSPRDPRTVPAAGWRPCQPGRCSRSPPPGDVLAGEQPPPGGQTGATRACHGPVHQRERSPTSRRYNTLAALVGQHHPSNILHLTADNSGKEWTGRRLVASSCRRSGARLLRALKVTVRGPSPAHPRPAGYRAIDP
jgi:hypothetical protein